MGLLPKRLAELLDEIVLYYNDVRTHHSRAPIPSSAAFEAREKVPTRAPTSHITTSATTPSTAEVGSRCGTLGSLRRLNVGWNCRSPRGLILTVDLDVRII